MAKVFCKKYKKELDALPFPPIPGEKGMNSRLRAMAESNAMFDETIGASVFRNANGDLVYAHQEELDEITAERDQLREQHDCEKKNVGDLRLRLSEFEKWLRRGAEDIMDWEVPESDDEL